MYKQCHKRNKMVKSIVLHNPELLKSHAQNADTQFNS